MSLKCWKKDRKKMDKKIKIIKNKITMRKTPKKSQKLIIFLTKRKNKRKLNPTKNNKWNNKG